jgi:hypothetical protein
MENAAVVRGEVVGLNPAEELAAEEGRHSARTRRMRARGRWMEGGRSSSEVGAGGRKRWTRLAEAWPEALGVLPELQLVEQTDRREQTDLPRIEQIAVGRARKGRKARQR